MRFLSAVARHIGRRKWIYIILCGFGLYLWQPVLLDKTLDRVVTFTGYAWGKLKPLFGVADSASEKVGKIHKNLQGQGQKKE